MSNVNDLMGQIRQGMDVYCSDGEKIGSVGDVNIGTTAGEVTGQTISDERSFFQVTRGGILGFGGDDLYIPAEQVREVADDRITLSCSSNPDEMAGWGTRPSAPQPTSSGSGGDDDTGVGLFPPVTGSRGTTGGTSPS